jgi:transcriptional regulator with XRE-family HTH domain
MNRIRTARLLLRISQAELGRRLRLSQGMISAFETGRLIPGPDLRKRLADALAFPEEKLFPEFNEEREA